MQLQRKKVECKLLKVRIEPWEAMIMKILEDELFSGKQIPRGVLVNVSLNVQFYCRLS